MTRKVVLAFSGGLDTSYCAVYLKQRGYEVITVTVDTGGLSSKDKEELERKAYRLGASQHHCIDAKERIYSRMIQYVIKLNALYGGDYPLMCADRYVIVEELLKVAESEGAGAVAHGCTAVGNDQVRFDTALATLAPRMRVIAPVRDLTLSRKEELAYLETRGFDLAGPEQKYSINENVLGITVSGSEIDVGLEPDGEAYQLTKPITLPGDEPRYHTLGFEAGLPVSLDGAALPGLQILDRLNGLAGSAGYGSRIYTGDCVIGIKGRILFEAPGLLALIEAHHKLEQVTSSHLQQGFGKQASALWTQLVYDGRYHEPVVRDIEAFVDHAQRKVSGTVRLKLEPNSLQVVEVHSENSLTDEQTATYAQVGCWTGEEVKGFIRFHSLQQSLAPPG